MLVQETTAYNLLRSEESFSFKIILKEPSAQLIFQLGQLFHLKNAEIKENEIIVHSNRTISGNFFSTLEIERRELKEKILKINPQAEFDFHESKKEEVFQARLDYVKDNTNPLEFYIKSLGNKISFHFGYLIYQYYEFEKDFLKNIARDITMSYGLLIEGDKTYLFLDKEAIINLINNLEENKHP